MYMTGFLFGYALYETVIRKEYGRATVLAILSVTATLLTIAMKMK
jgi:hypothetical protein